MKVFIWCDQLQSRFDRLGIPDLLDILQDSPVSTKVSHASCRLDAITRPPPEVIRVKCLLYSLLRLTICNKMRRINYCRREN